MNYKKRGRVQANVGAILRKVGNSYGKSLMDALKEFLDNSRDAGATLIILVLNAKEKFISIEDWNGHGLLPGYPEEDKEKIERFTYVEASKNPEKLFESLQWKDSAKSLQWVAENSGTSQKAYTGRSGVNTNQRNVTGMHGLGINAFRSLAGAMLITSRPREDLAGIYWKGIKKEDIPTHHMLIDQDSENLEYEIEENTEGLQHFGTKIELTNLNSSSLLSEVNIEDLLEEIQARYSNSMITQKLKIGVVYVDKKGNREEFTITPKLPEGDLILRGTAPLEYKGKKLPFEYEFYYNPNASSTSNNLSLGLNGQPMGFLGNMEIYKGYIREYRRRSARSKNQKSSSFVLSLSNLEGRVDAPETAVWNNDKTDLSANHDLTRLWFNYIIDNLVPEIEDFVDKVLLEARQSTLKSIQDKVAEKALANFNKFSWFKDFKFEIGDKQPTSGGKHPPTVKTPETKAIVMTAEKHRWVQGAKIQFYQLTPKGKGFKETLLREDLTDKFGSIKYGLLPIGKYRAILTELPGRTEKYNTKDEFEITKPGTGCTISFKIPERLIPGKDPEEETPKKGFKILSQEITGTGLYDSSQLEFGGILRLNLKNPVYKDAVESVNPDAIEKITWIAVNHALNELPFGDNLSVRNALQRAAAMELESFKF